MTQAGLESFHLIVCIDIGGRRVYFSAQKPHHIGLEQIKQSPKKFYLPREQFCPKPAMPVNN